MEDTAAHDGGFSFDPSLSPRDNVELFLDHLAGNEPEFAQLLRDHAHILVEGAKERKSARQEFNQEVLRLLEARARSAAKEQG